jgi:hypothetical protein
MSLLNYFLRSLPLALLLFAAQRLPAQLTDNVTLQGANPRVIFNDNSGTLQGFTVFADDGGFEIADTTNTTIPVHIDPNSPIDSLYIENTGYVGLGTDNPAYPLHVRDTIGTAVRVAYFQQTKVNGPTLLGLANDGTASVSNQTGIDFVLRTTASQRASARVVSNFSNTTDASRTGQLVFLAANNGAFVEAFRVRGNRVGINQTNPTNILQVLNAVCDGNSWVDASSRTLKHDIRGLASGTARDVVMNLTPVEYAYNDAPHDPRLGFIAEDVPEAVATPNRQTLSSMDIVAALTKVVQEQENEISEQQTVIANLAAQNVAILDRLAVIESQTR